MVPQAIQLRSAMEITANDLNQIASTLELILSAMYEPENEDQYREALTLLWCNLLATRDNAYSVCMDADRENIPEVRK